MVQILTANGFLNLREDTKANFKFTSPLFSNFQKANSLPFKVDKDDFFLQFGRIDSDTEYKETVIIYLSGIPIESGEIVLKSINEKSVDLYYQSKASAAKEALNSKTLHNLIVDIPIPQIEGFEYLTEFESTLTNYTLTYTLDFTNKIVATYNASSINAMTTFINDLRAGINAIYPGLATAPAVDQIRLFDPQNRNIHLKISSDPANVYISGGNTYFTTTIIKTYEQAKEENLNSYLNAIDQLSTVYFPSIVNTELRKEFTGIINRYDHINSKYFIENQVLNNDTDSDYSIVPLFRLAKIMDDIQSIQEIDLSNIPNLIDDLLIYNNKTIDSNERTQINNTEVYQNTHQQNIQAQNHLPNITLLALLERLTFHFNIAIYEQHSKLVLRYRKDAINTPAIDITDFQTYPYHKTPATKEGYLVELQQESKDNLSLTDTITLTDEANKVVLPMPTTNIQNHFFNGYNYNMPTVKHPEATESIPRLLKWQGFTPVGVNVNYPKADNENLGLEYIYQTYHKEWLEFLRDGSEIKKSFVFSLSLLQLLLDYTNPVFFFNHPDGAIEGVLKSIQISSTPNYQTAFIKCIFIQKP